MKSNGSHRNMEPDMNRNLDFAEVRDVLTAPVMFHRPTLLRDVSD